MSGPVLYDVPLLCSECDGEGGAWFVHCDHAGACPCPPVSEDCPRCDGTGNEPCDYCPDYSAVCRTDDGEQVCGRCYREVVLGVEPVTAAEAVSRGRSARAGGR